MIQVAFVLLLTCLDGRRDCPLREGRFSVHVLTDVQARWPLPLGSSVELKPDGRMTGFHGETIQDSEVTKYLRGEEANESKTSCLMLCPEESRKVTVEVLGEALDRLRRLSDPQRQTTIYVIYVTKTRPKQGAP